MSDYELIERLCGVTTKLADIVRMQAAVIRQAGLSNKEIETMQSETDDELDFLEYKLRGRIQ